MAQHARYTQSELKFFTAPRRVVVSLVDQGSRTQLLDLISHAGLARKVVTKDNKPVPHSIPTRLTVLIMSLCPLDVAVVMFS